LVRQDSSPREKRPPMEPVMHLSQHISVRAVVRWGVIGGKRRGDQLGAARVGRRAGAARGRDYLPVKVWLEEDRCSMSA